MNENNFISPLLSEKSGFFLPYIRYDDVYDCIKNSENYYPNFYQWFYGAVVDGHLSGEREIIVERIDGAIAAVAILKNTSKEKKLCNLTVNPRFKNRGLGVRLFSKAFDTLETEKPFFTVSEAKLPEFKRIFEHFGFEMTNAYEGFYQVGKVELFFNE